MKAAKVLGAHAPVQQPQSTQATPAADVNALDIDFSDVAMVPGEGPPPIPLRSASTGTSALLGPTQPFGAHARQESNSRGEPFAGMFDGPSPLSFDPPLLHNTKHQEISPFLFQEDDRMDGGPAATPPHHHHHEASRAISASDGSGTRGANSMASGSGTPFSYFSPAPKYEQLFSQQQSQSQQQQTPQQHPYPSQSHQKSSPYGTLHHRPSTPPHSFPVSASQVSLTSTTPSQARKSKNPLQRLFGGKKSVGNLRDGDHSPTSTPRMQSTPYNMQTPTTGGSIGSAFGSRVDLRSDNSAIGLDEELNFDEPYTPASFMKDAKKTKLPGRPRTRDKDSKKARAPGGHDNRSETPSFGMPGQKSGTNVGGALHTGTRTSKDVPLALDTNFDQIDDIVDTSLRQQQKPRQSMSLGPMNESIFDGRTGLAGPSEPPSPLSPRSGRERSTSVSFLEQQSRRATTSSSADSPHRARPGALRRLATATGSDVPTNRPMLQHASSARADIQSAGLQKMTRAEVQAILLARSASNGGTSTVTASTTTPTAELTMEQQNALRDANLQFDRKKSSATDFASLATTSTGSEFRDDRKASYASTSSRLTIGSDISPTTSVNNVAKAMNSAQKGPFERRPSAQLAQSSGSNGVDTSYRFPSSRNLDPRKSSTSSSIGTQSGNKVTSSWMAPDSWAVQPDTIRDALRDEEDDANDESVSPVMDPLLATSPVSLKRGDLASGRPSLTTSVWSGMTSPGMLHQGSISSSSDAQVLTNLGTSQTSFQGRRETIDSSASNPSTAALERDESLSTESSIEVLQPVGESIPLALQPQASSTSVAVGTGVPATVRPGSRGATTIGQAAAAAAGKLVGGLHRPSRIKLNRPGTGGSINGFPPLPPKGQSSTPTAEEDFSSPTSWKSSKRPHMLQIGQTSTKHTFMRVYKDDGTHTVVSISLEATASELRTILTRKNVDPAQANRLFVRDKGSERPLGKSEKPAILQRRRLLQAGYSEADSLEDIGREDLTFLLKFVYRPDRVTNFDSYSFGNTETDFNVLDLRNRNLEMVPIFLYRHGEWIKSLDLSGNPMHDIPLDFIQLCTNLTTLRLSHLSLKRIPQSIRHAVRLTHLDISDNRIRELAHINLSEIPQLMSLKAQNNRLTDLPAYFANMQSLLDLNISNNQFETFPTVATQLARLNQLDISFNTISHLPDNLNHLTRLQRLLLAGNNVEQLPQSISKMENLQAIDVRRNLLQDVTALFSLPSLEILKCEHNSIKQLDVTFGPRLKTVEVGQNQLSKAAFRASNTCSLTILNLSSANMAKLDEKVLSQLPNLTELNLDKNNLITLPDNLGQLSQLTKLSCANNSMATLPGSLGMLSQLTQLLVHDNNLKSLPGSIWHCGKLRHINVSSNVLESFPEPSSAGACAQAYFDAINGSAIIPPPESRKGSAGSLGAVPSAAGRSPLPLSTCLTKLRLGDNRLTEEVFSVLGQFTELQILNLSSNELYEIPTYGLSHMVKLRELYLSGNSLGSIPADVMPLLTELRILHLNGNKLQTLPAELGKMPKLVKLDVGNNTLKYNISNQQYDWNWNSNPSLLYLNLSGNKRLEINSNPVMVADSKLEYPGNPTRSHVGGWKRTDTSDFQRLKNLRLLGLMDVTVTLQQMPDEYEDRRVRTSLSQINQMAYGISDALGQNDHLSIVDFVVPRFRKQDNECLFGFFAGRGHGDKIGSRIAYHLAHYVGFRIQWEVQRLQHPGQSAPPEHDKVPDIIRRAFLRLEKEYADVLISEGLRNRQNSTSTGTGKNASNVKTDPSVYSGLDNVSTLSWRSGASAIMAYVIERTLFIANCGDSLAVMSRNGTAHLVSTKHEPFDRSETLRIRSAEGWVSLQGEVNDTLDVSRSFGHYHLAPIVNAAPAVTKIELSDSDEFVIMANSTLWDYIPYQIAVDIARMERDDPMLATQKLRDYAIAYGAEDSIMVMVVAVGDLFEKSRKAGQQAFGGGTLALNNYFGGVQGLGPASDMLGGATPFFEQPQWEGVKRLKMRHGGRDLAGDRLIARLEREVAPPVGQVALVFTDIRNSTSLWETNGGMQTSMRLHNTLLRRQLRTIGGYEVKTEGDAFMVSFQTVTSALLWCFQVQVALLKEAWPEEILESEDGKEIYDESTGELLYRGLSVRMGLHYGSPVCEADPITRRMDYFGPMVNRASRISGAAEGGQILASRDVINELRAIMRTFDEEQRGGRTFKDNEVSGSKSIEELLSPATAAGSGEDVEEVYRLLNPNVSREVVLLRRLGFAISEIGDRRLKGLETPEYLHLVYPKSLNGRFTKLLESKIPPGGAIDPASSESANAPDGKGPLNPVSTEDGNQTLTLPISPPPVEVFEPTLHLLNVDEVKMIGYLCLRLEALAQGDVFEGMETAIASEKSQRKRSIVETRPTSIPGAPFGRPSSSAFTSLDQALSPLGTLGDESDNPHKTLPSMHTRVPFSPSAVGQPGPLIAIGSARQTLVESHIHHHPELMLAGMRDDATDEELYAVLSTLTSRIWIALSSLSMRNIVAQKEGLAGLGLGVDIMEIVDKFIRGSS